MAGQIRFNGKRSATRSRDPVDLSWTIHVTTACNSCGARASGQWPPTAHPPVRLSSRTSQRPRRDRFSFLFSATFVQLPSRTSAVPNSAAVAMRTWPIQARDTTNIRSFTSNSYTQHPCESHVESKPPSVRREVAIARFFSYLRTSS